MGAKFQEGQWVYLKPSLARKVSGKLKIKKVVNPDGCTIPFKDGTTAKGVHYKMEGHNDLCFAEATLEAIPSANHKSGSLSFSEIMSFVKKESKRKFYGTRAKAFAGRTKFSLITH